MATRLRARVEGWVHVSGGVGDKEGSCICWRRLRVKDGLSLLPLQVKENKNYANEKAFLQTHQVEGRSSLLSPGILYRPLQRLFEAREL